VAHEPLDRVWLTVPRALAEAGGLEVSQGGRVLPLVRGQDDSPASKTVAMRALLTDDQGNLSERIGAFELVVRYPVAREKLLPDASASLDLPLLMPADGALLSNKVTIASSPGVKVQYREGPWKPLDTASQRLEQSPGLQLSTAERANAVAVALNLEASNAAASTIVERCWIQTQLGGGRQDRAIYRFTSNQPTFEVSLPEQVVFNDVSVLLNGQPAAIRVGSERRIAVAIPKDNARRPQLLELGYRFSRRDDPAAEPILQAPILDPEVWVRRTYWQVVLSPQQHVVATPPGFIGEFTWTWSGLGFGRHPVLDQAQLEDWCGSAATRRADLPAGSNVYLFSVLGPPSGLSLWTAGRTGLVFCASLACLAAGLILIYLPKLRTPLILVMIITIAGFGLVYPEPVLLLLQAGSLGCALALVAMLLERIVAPRRARSAPVRRGSSSIVDRALLHSPLQPAGNSSTRTAAIAAPAASPEQAP
jgi:hypothetical protein